MKKDDTWDGQHWIYMVDPATKRWHLVKADAMYVSPNPKTLCQLDIERLTEGDESLSGWRATCGGCRKEAGLDSTSEGH